MTNAGDAEPAVTSEPAEPPTLGGPASADDWLGKIRRKLATHTPPDDELGDHLIAAGTGLAGHQAGGEARMRAQQRRYADELGKPPRPAGVLIPLVERSGKRPAVILTRRTDKLRNHAGQVSFPGGRTDDGDASDTHAALREAHEEIGLPPERVDVIGQLARYRTGTGFRITPVVAQVDPGFQAVPSLDEVAAVFEVPLDYVFDPANHQLESAMWQGKRRYYYSMPYQGERIWGATAAMLVNLAQVVRAG